MSFANIVLGTCFGIILLLLFSIFKLTHQLQWWMIALNILLSGGLTWLLWRFFLVKLEAYHDRKIARFKNQGIPVSSFEAIPVDSFFYMLDGEGRREPAELQVKINDTTYSNWREKTGFKVIRGPRRECSGGNTLANGIKPFPCVEMI